VADGLRRWDAAFERRFESLIPRGWRVDGSSAGAGLIGAGLAYIVLGPLLLVIFAINDRGIVVPATFVVLGGVALAVGVRISRRRADEE
jgi:hypothetical protein